MKKLYSLALAVLILGFKATVADAQYCTPSAANCDEKITNFTLNTINNTSSSSDCGTVATGYSDFTTLSTTLNGGVNNSVSVTVEPYYGGDAVDIWIDYNRNGVFDANELVTTLSAFSFTNPGYAATGIINIPTTVVSGNLRLRARLRYNGTADPCSANLYGEAEDYTINVINTPCSGTPAAATITNTAMTNPICFGNTYTLNATDPNTTTGVTAQWQQSLSPAGPWVYVSGANSLTYVTPALSATTYYRISDSCTNSGQVAYSNVFKVDVAQQLAITAQPVSKAACPGSNTSFSVAANGTDLAYQWQVKSGASFVNITNNSTYTGATTATLQVANVNVGMDGYQYRCIISTGTNCSAAITSSAATLTAGVYSTITASDSLSFCQGDSVVLAADTGYTYQWLYNGQTIAGATNNTYTAFGAGQYSVLVIGTGCSAVSNVLTTSVRVAPGIPTVTNNGPDTFCWGSSVMLDATADPSVVSYQWYLNNSYIVGATGTSYAAPDSGNYTILVKNSIGCSSMSAPVHLTADIIPDSLIVLNGDFLCSAYTYNTYQWYLNGQLINGATNGCYMPTQNGSYSVFVTDSICSKMSSLYILSNVGVAGVTLKSDEIKIYPNPATSVVHIDAPEKVNVTIANLEGQIVSKLSNTNSVNISNLPNGMYLIRVYDKDNVLVKVQKLIKSDY